MMYSWLRSWPGLFKRWIAPSTGWITIQWIAQLVLLMPIRWIVIYSVDSAIHLLNNRGLVVFLERVSCISIHRILINYQLYHVITTLSSFPSSFLLNSVTTLVSPLMTSDIGGKWSKRKTIHKQSNSSNLHSEYTISRNHHNSLCQTLLIPETLWNGLNISLLHVPLIYSTVMLSNNFLNLTFCNLNRKKGIMGAHLRQTEVEIHSLQDQGYVTWPIMWMFCGQQNFDHVINHRVKPTVKAADFQAT